MTQTFWRTWLRIVCVGWCVCSSGYDDDTSSAAPPQKSDADKLAELINRRIEDGWRQNQIEPAPVTDDAEFLRRTYLNLVGRIPSVNEALEFLDEDCANKRVILVEQLLASPGYSSNFTAFWRDVIIPEATNSADPFNRRFGDIAQFEVWLRDRLEHDEGLDRLAREVITGVNEIPSEGNTAAFLRLKESKPENLAAGTARAFLGIRLECAQCHHHPFAKWRRDDFWKFAAFYGGIQTNTPDATGTTGRKITIPDSNQEVIAAFLDGSAPDFAANPNARAAMAKWITHESNNDFAQAVANRLWAHFFGVGIVEPVDDFDERNPASHPELLNELAQSLVEHHYDQKFLIRAITRSRPYQLSSRLSHASQNNPRLYGRMIVKGLTSDQLFDSLIWATGIAEPQQDVRVFRTDGQRDKFRELFGQQVTAPGEVQTSILQALLMLNGSYVDQATNPQQGRTLSALIEAPFFSHEQRLEILFIAVLARPPRPAEASALLTFIESQEEGRDWKQSLGDVYWALLNSSEFLLNH